MVVSGAIFLAAIVWFTPDLIAIKLAHFFQVYLSLLLFFSCSYLLSQARIPASLFSKELALALALILLILVIGGGVLTYYLNPVYGLTLMVEGSTFILSLLLQYPFFGSTSILSFFHFLSWKGKIVRGWGKCKNREN